MSNMWVFVWLGFVLVYGREVPLEYGPPNRIVGGKETTIDRRPYLVSIQVDGEHNCGGTIINANTILTAAHCTEGYSADDLYIRAGSSTIYSGGTRVAISRIIDHPNYVSSTAENDVSILKLTGNLIFGSNIAPASLSSSNLSTGTSVVVAGWGLTDESGTEASPVLLEVDVEIIDHDVCRNAYQSLRTVTDDMICAGTNSGGKDACTGDSGGPLVLASNNALVGVVSWGAGCGRAGYPGVYAYVNNYLTFIAANSG